MKVEMSKEFFFTNEEICQIIRDYLNDNDELEGFRSDSMTCFSVSEIMSEEKPYIFKISDSWRA